MLMAIVCPCGFGMQREDCLQGVHSAALTQGRGPWLQYKGLFVSGCWALQPHCLCLEPFFSAGDIEVAGSQSFLSMSSTSYPRV